MPDFLLAVATWLGTYLVHSTVLFGLAWSLERSRLVCSAVWREPIWRAALVGALFTASAQSAGLAGGAPMAGLLQLSQSAPDPRPQTAVAPQASAPARPARPTAAVGLPISAAGVPERFAPAAAAGMPTLAGLARLFVLIWLAGAGLFAARLGILGWRARRDLDGRAPADPRLRAELAELCSSPRLPVPALTMTCALTGPVALPNGEIVLPYWVTEALDRRQQRAVLAHELAHQARRDPLWLLLALAFDALLWVQPLHRLARRRLAALAELEADGWAARLLRDPRALAESLAACAERLTSHPVELWTAGMVAGPRSEGSLLERIDRLLQGTSMSTPRNSWPARAGAILVLSGGIFLLPGCGPARFGALGGGSSTSISISDGGDLRMSVRRPGYSLQVSCDGKVDFAADESDLATLAPGSLFELRERLDGVEQTYRIHADGAGNLQRTFARDGDPAPMNDATRQWVAAAIPRMFRESGWDADARVDRLLARGGPERVFSEVDLAASDHVKATYLGRLLDTVQLDAAQFASALACASRLGSDHELRTALERALATQRLDGARVQELLGVARKLGSDFELRSVLERVAPSGSDPAVAGAYLGAARQLGSDFERRTAVVVLLEQAKVDGPALAGALDIAAGLDSDFEKRAVLEVLAKRVAADPELNRRYREVAREMSDFERGQALRALDDATAL